jgi:AcrR family transcriptional regulator
MVKHRVLDQQKVLATAGEMASESGVANLNFKALAARLDIRSQSLYNYYPNIEAVIEALGADFLRATRYPTDAWLGRLIWC